MLLSSVGSSSHCSFLPPAVLRQKSSRRAARAQFRPHAVAGTSFAQGSAHTPPQQQAAAELKAWVLAHSNGRMPTQLFPAPQMDKGGYGMITEQPVQPGQPLVRVPRKLMMTEDSALRQDYGKLCKQCKFTEWQALILHLLCERAKGPGSFWAPYINMLPKQDHHPLMWTAEDVSMLQGSPLLHSLQTRWQQVLEDTEALEIGGANDLPLAQAYFQAHKEELVSQSSVAWAAATLLSRAFSLDMTSDDEVAGDLSHFGTWMEHVPDALALVPWADMLCHSSQAGPDSCLRFDSTSQSAALAAHKPYEPGEEVFDSYGCNLSPIDLLLDYGFVDPQNTNHRTLINPYDIAQPRSGRAKTLLEAMAVLHGTDDARLVLSHKGPDTSALAWVRAALSSDAELIRAGWRVKATKADVALACKVMGTLSQPTHEQREVKVLGTLHAAVQQAQRVYPTSLEQDLEQLQQQGLPWRRQQMLMGLVSEKQALRGCLHTLEAFQHKLASGCILEDLYESEESEEEYLELGSMSSLDGDMSNYSIGAFPGERK